MNPDLPDPNSPAFHDSGQADSGCFDPSGLLLFHGPSLQGNLHRQLLYNFLYLGLPESPGCPAAFFFFLSYSEL